MPTILSNIRSDTRATNSNNTESQRRSVNNIAQHPRYRKAILRIGESNYHVRYLNHIYTIRFSFVSYCIALDKFHRCRPGFEQYDSRCKYSDGHLRLLHFILRSSNLSSSHRISIYLSSASGLLC